MSTTSIAQGTIWVCVDCLHADVNGEEPTDRPAAEPAPWALWADDTDHDVTVGALCEEGHDHTSEEHAEGCEERSFSWSSCEGCGSTLGGSRHAFTCWTR